MLFATALPFLVPSRPQGVTNSLPKNYRKFSRPRRGFLTIAVAFLLTPAAVAQTAAPQRHDLSPKLTAGQVRLNKVILEVAGELKTNADGKQVTKLPLKVRGELKYHELLLAVDNAVGSRSDLRWYDGAKAAIQVGETPHTMHLRDSHRVVSVDSEGDGSVLSSPAGPFTREELELVDVQANGSLVDRLLPNSEVEIGESWAHDNGLIAALLRIDAVHQSDCQSTLRKIKNQVAVIDLKGDVAGAVGGVSSDIALKAVYHFDLQQRRIIWLSVTFEEQRAIGHAEPGFEVKARLRFASTPAEPPSSLRAAAARRDAAVRASSEADRLLLFHGSGGFRFVHGRQWRAMIDRHDVSILRLIEQGDLVAQCNASALPDVEAGKQLELASFEADVKRALGANFGKIEAASQEMAPSGVRVLRAVVTGAVSDVPIQWTYYHLSNKDGRQAAVVFTLQADLVEQFRERDQTLIGSFEFQATTPVAAVEPD